MIGTVTFYHYNQKASGHVIPFWGIEIEANIAYIVLNIRIVDVSTSSVVYASTQVGEATNKSKRDKSNELLVRAANNAVEKSISSVKKLTWLNAAQKNPSRRVMNANSTISSRPTLTIRDFLYETKTGEVSSSGAISSVMESKLYEAGDF